MVRSKSRRFLRSISEPDRLETIVRSKRLADVLERFYLQKGIIDVADLKILQDPQNILVFEFLENAKIEEETTGISLLDGELTHPRILERLILTESERTALTLLTDMHNFFIENRISASAIPALEASGGFKVGTTTTSSLLIGASLYGSGGVLQSQTQSTKESKEEQLTTAQPLSSHRHTG